MTGMSDIHALSGAFALDALDAAERAEFETHLAACAACQAEVASFHETSALLAETATEAPPASLRAGVLAGISEVRPLPPETPTTGSAATVTPLRRRTLPILLAAAASVVLLLGVLAVWHPWTTDHRSSVAEEIVNAPDAVRVTEKLPGGAGELTLVRSPSLGKAVMIGDHVPAPPSGKTYQLWLQQPGKGMVSAGLMSDPEEPTVLTGDAATATAAAVSVEPDTGSTKPTTDPVALFPFPDNGEGGA